MKTKPIINWTDINILKGTLLLRIQKNRTDKGLLTLIMIVWRLRNTQSRQCKLSCFLEASQKNNNQ